MVIIEPVSSLQVLGHDGGCRLRLKVKPRAARDEIVGVLGSALKVSIKAAAEGGKANRAVCSFLARVLDVGISSVTILTGAGSPDKTAGVTGLSPEECLRRLESYLKKQ